MNYGFAVDYYLFRLGRGVKIGYRIFRRVFVDVFQTSRRTDKGWVRAYAIVLNTNTHVVIRHASLCVEPDSDHLKPLKQATDTFKQGHQETDDAILKGRNKHGSNTK